MAVNLNLNLMMKMQEPSVIILPKSNKILFYDDELTVITRIVNLHIFIGSRTWITKDGAIYRNIALRAPLTPRIIN